MADTETSPAEAEPGGGSGATKRHPATTTISTISLQSGETKLVIALLQSGESLYLKVLEVAPEMTQLGATLSEALTLQRQHEEVLRQLQNKQSPVEELLHQADQLISTQRPRAEVYAAMAESLGAAWKDINDHLELRKQILDLNVTYQNRAEDCIERMLALEMACRDMSIPVEIEAVKHSLRSLHDYKRLMLESLMVTLQDGRALHDKLKEVAAQGTLDSRPDRIAIAAKHTVSQIGLWLEELHDRRKLLEDKWLSTKMKLEQCLCLALLAKDLKELDETLAVRHEALKRTCDQMGDSASSAELLLHEHKKLIPEAKEFQDRCLKITKATEKLISSGHFAIEEAIARAYIVLNSCAEYSDALEEREAMLHRAIAFFRSAHTAFTKLDQLQVQLTNTDLSRSNFDPSLVTKALEEITVQPLQDGYSLLETIGSTPGVDGIQSTVQEIEKRKLNLENLCLAQKEENIQLSKAHTTFLAKHNYLYSWLVSIAEAFLQGHQDMGSVLAMAEDFVQLHQQLLNDLQSKGVEINDLLLTLPPLLKNLNDDQRTDIDEKVDTLHSHWLTLKSILEVRVDLAILYAKFHYLSVELAKEFDAMEAEFKKDTEIEQEDMIRHVEQKWLHIQQLYGQLSNLGKSFIEKCSKVDDPYLDGKRASLCVETLLEHFGSRQLIITESWQTWQNNITIEHELKILWERNLTESDRTLDWVSTLDTKLYPILTGESSTSSIITKELEEKLRVVLSELKKAQTEIELRVKTAENLALKGDFQEQKEALINKLMQQHCKLNNFASDYQVLLQMLISFLKNLSELEKTIENLQSLYRPTRLPNSNSELDVLIKEHESSKQAVLELFKYAQKESEQIINRIKLQEPPKEAHHDIERVFRLLEIKKLAWESAWTDRKLLLDQHHQLLEFDSDLQQINATLDDLSRQLNSLERQYRESLNGAKATSMAFVYFEKTIQLLETKIETFINTAENNVKSDHSSLLIEQEVNQLRNKWTGFRNQVNASRSSIDLSIEYFTLVEEAEEWLREGSKLLVSVARKTTAVKNCEEAEQLLTEIETYMKSGQMRQEERIKKISTFAIQLYGEERSRQVTLVVNENKEMIDSFTKISEELRILGQNLRDAEEQRKREKQEQEQREAVLATVESEAAGAEAPATAAEEAIDSEEVTMKVLNESIPSIERVEFESAIPIVPDGEKEVETARSSSPPHKKAKVSEDVPTASAPIFTVPLLDSTIEEGKRFTFECRVTGFPIPEVIWYKDGISIQNNPDYQTLFNLGICTLTIEETFTEDSARFTCKAVNAAGTAETNATLSVTEAEREEQLVPPVFTKRIESQSAKEGSTFHLTCSVQGIPLPTIQWFKNDVCIDNSSDYVITYNNGEADLKFEEVFLDDQGEYTCKASNLLGVDVCSARLTVEPLEPTESPVFITPLSNTMARAGRKLKLFCEVTGLPLPELTWTHNGKIIKEARDIKLQYEDGTGTLIVNEAFPKDAGTYTVVAKNISGESTCTCNVSVKGRLPTETSDSEIASDLEPVKPSIQLSLKDVTVLEGKGVRLDCIIVGQPEPEVIWYHNNQPVKESSDFQLLFQGDRCSLIIREAYLEDTGEYKVVAINSGGEASSLCYLTVKPSEETESVSKRQEILEVPVGTPPRFNKLLTDILAPQGERVIFECIVLGDPKPVIKWYLNNQEITDVTSKQFNEDAEGCVSLTLLEVSPQDRGVYTVKASNSFGEAKCFANLIVKSSTTQETQTHVQMEEKSTLPSFKELFADRTVPEDSYTKFECIVSGKPTPKVRWTFNNEPVTGKDFLVSTSGERQVLTIQNVQKAHSGNVACTAENEAGKATCTAKLSVTDPDIPPVLLSSETVDNIESSTFTMRRSVFMQSSSQTSSIVLGSAEPHIQEQSITSLSEQSIQQNGQKSPIQIQSQSYKKVIRNTENSKTEQKSTVKEPSGGEDTPGSSCYSTPIASPKPVRKSVAPRFISLLNGKIVDQGADVVLEGIIDGYPEPTVSWTKNGKELLPKDEKLSMNYEHNRVEIILKNAMVEDAGQYTCKAVNNMGCASSTADLVVKKTIFPPVFGRRLHSRSVKEGERVVMEVEITGTPTPTVKWCKDQQPILGGGVPDQTFRTKIEGNCYSLIIEKASLAHSGQYSVKAVNSGGEAETLADFAVYKSQPEIETVKQEIFEDLRESIIEKQTQLAKPAARIQDIPVISTRGLSPSPSGQMVSTPLEKPLITESRIITETTKTEKQISLKLERTPSPLLYKPDSLQGTQKAHIIPVQTDQEKKEEPPVKCYIQKPETVITKLEPVKDEPLSSVPSIPRSAETEIKVQLIPEYIPPVPDVNISVSMEDYNTITSKQDIFKNIHIQREEEKKTCLIQVPSEKAVPRETVIPVSIETSPLESKIALHEPKQSSYIETVIEIKEETKDPQVPVMKAEDIQISLEPTDNILSNAMESGVETSSVSKKTALDFFTKKLKESEENLKQLKEPMQRSKQVLVDKPLPEIQQLFHKTEIQSYIDVEDRPPLSQLISSQSYSKQSGNVKFEKKIIYPQHQLSDSLLEEFNIHPEPPPEMGFIPKSEGTGKYREDVTTRVKKLEETNRVLSPTEIPTGGIRIFPAPVAVDESRKQQSVFKTVSHPVEQESITKTEFEVILSKKESLRGSGDLTVQSPFKQPSEDLKISTEDNQDKLKELFTDFPPPVSSKSNKDQTEPVEIKPGTMEPLISEFVASSPPTPAVSFSHTSSFRESYTHTSSEPSISAGHNLPVQTIAPKSFQASPATPKDVVRGNSCEQSVTKSELLAHSSTSLTEITRSVSPKPSAEGLAMEKLWIPQKPLEPDITIPQLSTVGPYQIERGASPKPSVEGLAMDKIWAHKRPDSGLRNVWPPPEHTEDKTVIPWAQTKSAPDKIWHPIETAVRKTEEIEVISSESVNQELTKYELMPSPKSNLMKGTADVSDSPNTHVEIKNISLLMDQTEPMISQPIFTNQIPVSPVTAPTVTAPDVPHYVAKTSVMHSAKTVESKVTSSEITTSTVHHTVTEDSSQLSGVTTKESSPHITQESNIKPSESKTQWPPTPKGISQMKSPSVLYASRRIEHYDAKPKAIEPDQRELAPQSVLEPGPQPEIQFASLPLEHQKSDDVLIQVLKEEALNEESSCQILGAVQSLPSQKEIIPRFSIPPKEKIETNVEVRHHVDKKNTKKYNPVIQSKPFERFPDLEPFPFKLDAVKSRPAPCPPPPKPSKFLKGIFTESDYESDWESSHIPPKWRPYESDTEELSYRKVKPPTLVHPLRSKSTEPEPIPPTQFEQPLHLDGPPRPQFEKTVAMKGTKSVVIEKTSMLQTQKIVQTKAHSQSKTDKVKKQQTNGFQKKQTLPILKPGSPPEYVRAVPNAQEQHTFVKTDATSLAGKPDSPKSKTKVTNDFPESGYMADTDEPRQLKHLIHKSSNIKHECLKTTDEINAVTDKSWQHSLQTPAATEAHTDKKISAQPPSRVQVHYRHHVHQTQKKLTSEETISTKTLSTKVHHKYSEIKHEKKGVTSVGTAKPKKEVVSTITHKSVPAEHSKDENELKLLPFPFKPDPPGLVVKQTVGPPPPSPSKFVKGEFREVDYESDYDSRILPKWKPPDSDADEPSYRPVRPVLTPKGNQHSRSLEIRTPTPPTEFDNPPEFAGPPRPKFEPIDKISQSLAQSADSVQKSPTQAQKVFKPKPITPKAVPPIEVVVATPAVKQKQSIILEPGPRPEMGYAPFPQRTIIKGSPFENATQIETSKVINYAESTKHTHRVVNVQQTTHVIQCGGKGNKVFESVPQFSSPKSETQPSRSKCTPPSQPKKFMPGEFHESEYESDIESIKIKPIWTPGNSDTEEPHYRRVRPPQMTRSSSVPAQTGASNFPHKDSSTMPLYDKQTFESQKEVSKVEEMRTKHGVTLGEQRRASLNTERQIVQQQDIKLEPGKPPEFCFAEKPKSTASYLAAKHMSEMTSTFKSKAQQFASNIMTDVSSTRQRTQPEKAILKPTDSINNNYEKAGDDPQAYREESRVAEYGTKHIDPDTGLIYFKYDFGYEFGIVLPGEGKKFVHGSSKSPQTMPQQRNDIEVPVIHEKTASANEDLSNLVADTEKSQGSTKVPQFRPKKFTHFKSVKWEPASESEMSEAEGDSARDKIPYSLPQPRSSIQNQPHIHIPASSRWEPPIPSPLSLSLSPSLPSLSPCTGATLDSTASPGGSWQGLSPSKNPRLGHGRGSTPTPPSTPSSPGSGHAGLQLRKPPSFITPLRDIAVVKGQTARFECIVQAEPSPNILWAKDGRLLENSENYHIHYRNGVCRLTLPQAFPDDVGTYSCTATNMLGTVGTSGTLQVPGEKRTLN